MKSWTVLLVTLLLAACASNPAPQRPDALFNDALFGPPSERIGADGLFVLSHEMKQFLNATIMPVARVKGSQQATVRRALRQRPAQARIRLRRGPAPRRRPSPHAPGIVCRSSS